MEIKEIKDSDLVAEIAGYARISVDTEADKDNTSIENQISFIEDYARAHFPNCRLTIYQDRDRSGYTFDQREDYQRLRKRLMSGEVRILIVKDFSRFSRRNSLGLVELETLRDAGVRIISITDAIDYPTSDAWFEIQFRFLLNEHPVTDASKKVRAVVEKSQAKGEWVCAVPYGYAPIDYKQQLFEVVPDEAEVVRDIFRLYGEGLGYKKICNYLTERHIPTPRMKERERAEAARKKYKRSVNSEWNPSTIFSMLANDFYIGTLRQHKYQRAKINGVDVRVDDADQIVFEKHHESIIDDRTFYYTQEQIALRTKSHYRGIKKYNTDYTGYLYCGDCGAGMFSMSRPDLAAAYVCGAYHKHGVKACSSHHTRVDFLDAMLKDYVRLVKQNSEGMIGELEKAVATEADAVRESEDIITLLQNKLAAAKEELKATKKRKVKDMLKHPDDEDLLEDTYAEMEQEITERIYGLENQLKTASEKRNAIIEVNRAAKTVFEVFDNILSKERLDKVDISLIVDRIDVYASGVVEVKLKADIEHLLQFGTLPGREIEAAQYTVKATHQKDKPYTVNVVHEGDPLEIYTERDGEVIFKKYSPMGELTEFAVQICDALSKTTDGIALVCDRDSVIAVSGAPKREFMDKRLSGALEKLLEARKVYRLERGGADVPVTDGDEKYRVAVAAPILAEGDLLGCVVFVSPVGAPLPGEVELKLAGTVAGFLGKQMES